MARSRFRQILKSEQTLTFGWRDRLRILWSGRLHVEHFFGCEHKPGRVQSAPMKWAVLPRHEASRPRQTASQPEEGAG